MHTDIKATSNFNLRYLSMLTALLALFVLCALMTKPASVVVTGETAPASPSLTAFPLSRAG